MKRFNLHSIFHEAWRLHRQGVATFALALRIAWANAKLNDIVRQQASINVEAHSWAGWRALGYTVRHGEAARYFVMVADPKARTGYRKKSYFTRNQVELLEA